jgi:cyclophilin family peptidyl-prolyl cis-trans isomerase
VENFLKLAREGYYEQTTFHRIVPAFIVQGGDPISRTNWKSPRLGTGGPGYTLSAEIGRKHVRGAVAAARKSDEVNPAKESSGSQFFICLADLPSLDRNGYTVFGQVVEGMEVVEKISRVKNSGEDKNQALSRVVMTEVKVLP